MSAGADMLLKDSITSPRLTSDVLCYRQNEVNIIHETMATQTKYYLGLGELNFLLHTVLETFDQVFMDSLSKYKVHCSKIASFQDEYI